MPITESAKKALRQNIRRRVRNVVQAKALKEVIKKFKKSPSAELLPQVYKKLDKAAKTNIIKRNKAARLKSRLSRLLKK
ncbi:MAG TPA: 30S ribosomal protein S20 [Candidatus Paceibacterota bacterium]